ncbi:hypothetical protein QUC30_16625 [Aeromonas caviae]|uniref:hypothetical protein n=1 Tax=Aeromonas caviae TaxID=648 RepID=UPI003D2EEC21
MYWPDTNTGVDVEPTRKPVASAVRKFFTEGGVGQPPTVPGGDWFNQITNELLNVVTAAGLEPSKTEDDQLLKAVKAFSFETGTYETVRLYDGVAKRIYVTGRDTIFDGCHGWFFLDQSDTSTPDNDGTVLVTVSGLRFKRLFEGDVLTLWFGDVGGATDDSTRAIQRALNFAEEVGVGVVMGSGTRFVSIAESESPYACLLLPHGAMLKGAGKYRTTIQRLVSERGDNGILIVTKGWDVNGGYGASGNIVISDFGVTDGDVTPARSLGDLIAICHSDGFEAYRIHGGNHDQHLFDVCSSKNVWIDPSCSGENHSPQQASATIQVDGTNSLGVWGAVIDGTPLENVYIRGTYKNTGALRAIELFHSNFTDYKNVDIDVYMDAAYIVGSSCIAMDPNQTSINVDGLKIRGTFKGNHGSAVICNLFNNVSDGYVIDNVDVDIKTEGLGRGGIFAGIDAATAGRWGKVNIRHHARLSTTLSSYASGFIYGQKFAGVDNLELDDDCDVEIVRDSGSGANYLTACAVQACGGKSSGGRYRVSVGTAGHKYVTPFYLSRQAGSSRNMDFKIEQPVLEAGDGVGHHFLGEDVLNGSSGPLVSSSDKALLSGAKFLGNVSISNILESIPFSDGTNGFRQVSLDGSTLNEFPISAGQLYASRQMGLKKNGSGAGISKIQLKYAPNAGGVDDDAEDIQFAYLSATTCVGTQIADVNLAAGNFSILTGVSGVSMVINNSTFQPVVRLSGYLKAWCSI